MDNDNNLSPLQQISSLNYKFDLGEFSIFDLYKDNEDRALIKKEGQASDEQIWYAVDNNDQIKAIVPFDFFTTLLDNVSSLNKEIMELKLEKAIWKYLPKDFHDVYTVVNSRLAQNPVEHHDELDEVIQNIKKEYPNLFIDMDDMLHHQ